METSGDRCLADDNRRNREHLEVHREGNMKFFTDIVTKCTGIPFGIVNGKPGFLYPREYSTPIPADHSAPVEKPMVDKPLATNNYWFGKRTGVPHLYRDASFDSFVGYRDIVDKLRENIGNDMILDGISGCGKTHLAIAVAREQMSTDKTIEGGPEFIPLPELMLQLRDSFGDDQKNNGNPSEADIVKKYTNAKLVILDDVGADKTSEYSLVSLYLIINGRMNAGRQTIITTNLKRQGIEKWLGSRIASRLSTFEHITINAPDYRGSNAARKDKCRNNKLPKSK